MNAIQAIRIGIDTGEMICMGYLNDLTDAEMMHRPAPDCNHINWQVGHLIASEHGMMEQVFPGSMPPLPAGFAEKYAKGTAGIDDTAAFASKAELLQIFKEQRTGTLATLEKQSPEDLDGATQLSYAPTLGSLFSLHGSHWLMHAGQWAVVRRQCGRPPLF